MSLRLLCCAVLIAASGLAHAEELLVFAPASTADAMTTLKPIFEKQSGHRVTFSFAASSTLMQQIQNGAKADVFVSADEAKMDAIAAARLLRPDSRFDLLTNSLVVVVPPGSTHAAWTDAKPLTSMKRIALGNPDSVPAGIYAKAWLQKIGVWSQVESRVVPTLDVRAALAAVQAGRADAAVVYKTDALISQKTPVVYAVPPAAAPTIAYPAAALARGKKGGDDFLKFLRSADSAAVFSRYGFGIARQP